MPGITNPGMYEVSPPCLRACSSSLAYASMCAGPADLQQEQILAKMPAFFRAIRGQEYDENDLREMIEDVRKLHQPGN